MRPGCHLCEEALDVLERLRADPSLPELRIEPVDIEADEALLGAYLERIPVVSLDGEQLYEFAVDERDLRRRLAEQGGPSR